MKRRRLIGIAFPVMVAGRVLGAAISPFLFAHAPVALILLSPFLVHLVVVGPLVGAEVFFPVALAVTTLQCIIGYLFGTTYGPRAQTWLIARTPVSEARAEIILSFVRRASAFAIFAIPGPILGVIAGVAGIRRRVFFFVVAPAQAIWVAAAFFVGEALLEWISIGREFVIEHAFALTGVTLGLVAVRWLVSRLVGPKDDVSLDVDES